MAAKPRPRPLGRDGISIMVNHDRALRAREISQPTAADRAAAAERLDELLARRLSPRSNRSARS